MDDKQKVDVQRAGIESVTRKEYLAMITCPEGETSWDERLRLDSYKYGLGPPPSGNNREPSESRVKASSFLE
jgi:hypothetical protein